MKKYFSIITMFLILFLGNLSAQEYDYLDVPPGFETLNLALEGDTTETGEPQSYMRVYRLERGGFYLLNGRLNSVGDAPMRVFAAEGEGPMPVIIPAADESGESDRFARPETDIEVRGLYVSGIDNLGNQATKNMIRPEGTGQRIVIDGCMLDHDAQSFIRMNADSQKLFVNNSTMRNSFLLADPGNGRFVDTRGNYQDTIMLVNSTFYVQTNRVIRTSGNPFNSFIVDHCTFYQINAGGITTGQSDNDEDGCFDLRNVRHAKIINSLFMDFQFEGDEYPTNLDPGELDFAGPMFGLDTLFADSVTIDTDRTFILKNNYYGVSDELEAYFAEWGDTVKAGSFLPDYQKTMWFDTYEGFEEENNVEHYVEFSDPPSNDVVITYARHRRNTDFSNVENPNPAADRNGQGEIGTDPDSFGPAADEFDFDYSTSDPAYTAAEGGFPLGDLNWFPDKLDEWLVTDVEEDAGAQAIPTQYSLEQNYPNPFNPSTTIKFSVPEKSKLSLTIYNIVGQQVKVLVNDQLFNPGSHNVIWNGKDASGSKAASGIYFYELRTDDVVMTNKMILMK